MRVSISNGVYDFSKKVFTYKINIEHQFHIEEVELRSNFQADQFTSLIREKVEKALVEIRETILDQYKAVPIKQLKDPFVIEGEIVENI